MKCQSYKASLRHCYWQRLLLWRQKLQTSMQQGAAPQQQQLD
jgi:hypothetical protein